jgi:DNA repair protein RecO (recombination protein O)
MNYKTRGIIIKRRNFGEADRILTIFTKNRGKISAIAKGVRKTLSKLGGHVELFYVVDLILSEGRNFDIVTGAEIIENFPNLRNNIKLAEQSYYIAELTDKLVNDSSEASEIYDLLYKTLESVNNKNNPLALRYFELWLLSELGHKPETDLCAKCRNDLNARELFWSNELGGVVCKDCKTSVNNSERIDVDIVKIIRLFLNYDINIINRIKINREQGQRLEYIIENFIKYITDYEFNSKKFTKG